MAVTGTAVTSATFAVTQAEAKLYAKIDGAADNDIVDGLIEAASAWAENFTRRRFVDATEVQYFDEFSDTMELTWAPVDSVTSVQYIDVDGATQTLSATVYDVDTTREPGAVYLAYNQSWPATRAERNAVIITYVAGYGTSNDVPEGIKAAMKQAITHWYEHRETAEMAPAITEVPLATRSLLTPFIVPTVP